MKKAYRIFSIVIIVLILGLIAIRWYNTRMIVADFIVMLPEQSSPLDSLPFEKSVITLDDHTLAANFLSAGENADAIFICTGNGEILTEWKPLQAYLLGKGYSTFVFSYSGFGDSSGEPSERNLNNDVKAAYIKFISLTPGASNRIALSHSMGGGPLLKVASGLDPLPSKLVISAPFSSVRDYMVEKKVVSKGLTLLMPDMWNSNRSIKKIEIPILIIHSKDDEVVPYTLGEKLSKMAGENCQLLTLDKYGHNAVYQEVGDDFFMPVLEFISTNSEGKNMDMADSGRIKTIAIETPKGKFNVWTKSIGNNPKLKLLLLHGGPGATHEYLECFTDFLPDEGIEIIYYDQLGSGNSDNPADTSLWNIPRFVEEVEQVRLALNLDSDNFYLLGQSWGGALALEYALKYQENLKGLIISNMMSSCPDYDRYANEVLAKQMDPKVVKRIRELEEKGEYDSPEYMELLMPNYYEKHLLRLPADEWPEPVLRSFEKQNTEIYVMMQGPSEFGIAGKLEKWDRSGDLSKIKVPTLVIGAEYDTMDPEHMKWMSEQFPLGSYLYCPQGSHLAMWDDQEVYIDGLIYFIKNNSE